MMRTRYCTTYPEIQPVMAEGFASADYVTSVRLSDLEGKRPWLLRVPRHVDTKRLEVKYKYASDVKYKASTSVCKVVRNTCSEHPHHRMRK